MEMGYMKAQKFKTTEDRQMTTTTHAGIALTTKMYLALLTATQRIAVEKLSPQQIAALAARCSITIYESTRIQREALTSDEYAALVKSTR
jgi:hypothetical protein